MSGQELIPFVAEVFRDKAILDLQAENEDLRQQLVKAKQHILKSSLSNEFTITGPGGAPIYARGNLKDSLRDFWDDEHQFISYHLAIDTLDLSLCKVRDIDEAEIRRGGVFLFRFSDKKDVDCVSAMPDSHVETVYWFDSRPGIDQHHINQGPFQVSIYFNYGPIPEGTHMHHHDLSPDHFRNDQIAEVEFTHIVLAVDERIHND